MINFNVYFKYIKLKSPPKFRIEKHRIEYREDPLTKDICRLNIERTKRPHSFDSEEVEEEIESNEDCPFCRENIMEKTPRFERVMSNKEHVHYNDFVMLPNLYPFAQIHAMGILTKKHFVSYDKITENEWENAIYTAIMFLKAQAKYAANYLYPSINFNYLMPAGASLVHPHIQIIADETPPNYTKKILEAAKKFHEKNDVNYFRELVLQDKQREIYQDNNIWFKAKFAPSADKEILGVMLNKSSFCEIEDTDILSFTQGLVKILSAYKKIGVKSLNMSIISAPMCSDEEKNKEFGFFNIIIRIVARPKLTEEYTADCGFMEVLQQTPIITTLPEDLTQMMRDNL
ncbi:MAG: hypothetical protein DRN66_00390 [Candidatus Nanohalarchaeota archaeon]|nr:MAG: hypothetical protein DRN66_00390 [Candidatus Nanohaloarchaeota archaeon]